MICSGPCRFRFIENLLALQGARDSHNTWTGFWGAFHEHSQPVRIGNAACDQRQWDVYGELSDTMFQARVHGLAPEQAAWNLERALIDFVEESWQLPDHDIWEVRGARQQFTHSKVMAWVALDRAIKSAERFALDGDVGRWRATRQEIHDEVCNRGYSDGHNSFMQCYGSDEFDASLLMIPLVGFLPPTDSRVVGTVAAIERYLTRDGFVRRYRESNQTDGLEPGEGVFLPCSFWLADCYALAGRWEEAERLFERLLQLRNELGLLSEEYDPDNKTLLGNSPQALSHIALINTAINLQRHDGSAACRSKP
jgi:pentatricopeptide repeat protein